MANHITYTPVGMLFRTGHVEEAEAAVLRAFAENSFRAPLVAQALGVKQATVESWLNRRPELRKRIREAQAEFARRELDKTHAKS